MATLHVEHAISDFTRWKAAFDRLADRRREAGVTDHRIHQPHDDAKYVVLQLDFATVEQAQAFREFLESSVWSNPASSPALEGTPRARVLVDAPQRWT